MPIIVNMIFCSGVLWALLIIFNESGSYKFVQQEAMTIVGIVTVVGMIAVMILPTQIEFLAIPVQAGCVFYGAEILSQLSRRSAIRVTAWYCGITFLTGATLLLLLHF